jgi:hypothetical protein
LILHPVQCKIYRAHAHLQSFHAERLRYFSSKPNEVVMNVNLERNAVESVSGPIPIRIPLIIGACVQNLRSSLDYLVWEMILAAQQTPTDKNQFPICSEHKRFTEAVKKGRLGGLGDEAIAAIERLRPYHGTEAFGAHPLWVINELTNINKHRHILVLPAWMLT